MSWFSTTISPRLIDIACSPASLTKWRARCLDDLEGTVVEIGCGSGRNFPIYPSEVTSLLAVEPSTLMRERAQSRVGQAPCPVRWSGLDGQRLELEDDSCDAAVATFVLCTIPDPGLALRELLRVVRPGGELRVLEHGLAPRESVAKWQRRLDPLERFLADGCSLSHDPLAAVVDAGWDVTSNFSKFVPGPKPWSYFSSIRARRPA